MAGGHQVQPGPPVPQSGPQMSQYRPPVPQTGPPIPQATGATAGLYSIPPPPLPKGQLISECLSDVLNFPKKERKNFINFCPKI